MITISKTERDYLENKGYKMGMDIHRTYSHHISYFATESQKLTKDLMSYRKNKIVK